MDAKKLGKILQRFPRWTVRVGRSMKGGSSVESPEKHVQDALVGPGIADILWNKERKEILLLLALPPLEQPSSGLISKPQKKLWLPGDKE